MNPRNSPHLARYGVVGPESLDLKVPPELVLLPDLEGNQVVLELRLVYGAVHLEQPLHEVPEARRDEDCGRAQPEESPRGHVHGEAADVVEVSVGDEEELLRDGALRTTADVEGEAQRREDDAGLLAADGEALHGVPLDLHPVLRLGSRWRRGSRSKRRGGGGGRSLRRGLADLRHPAADKKVCAAGSRGGVWACRGPRAARAMMLPLLG